METSDKDHLIPYRSRLRNPFLESYDFDSLYWRLVRDYTGRDMSLASDSLNAFSAFIGQFERRGVKLRWGMPIVLSSQQLLWEHEPWDFGNISRRKEFPSWSWAGWCGTAARNFPLDAEGYTCTTTEELPDSYVLYCNARTARLRLTGQSPLTSVVGDPVSSFILDLGLYTAPSPLTEGCVMMEVSRINDTVHGLLVEQKGDFWERIGSGFVKLSIFEAASPEWQVLRIS